MATNIHFHPNGNFAAKFVAPLVEAENAFGHSSSIVCSTNPFGESNNCIRYDLTINNLLLLPLSFLKIIILLKKIKPNCLVSHNTKASPLPLLAAKLLKIKNIVYFNHGVPYIGHSGLTRELLKLIEHLNCFLATEIITVSKDMAEELREICKKRIKLIGNGSACGIDLNIYSKKKYAGNFFKKNLGLNSKDIAFVFIGRPEKRKGYNFIIDIWVKHFANKTNYKLILCGSSVEDLKANLYSIPNNIIPLGFVDNIPEVLSNSDCLVLPSSHEGLPYALLEAMACECLVISNNIPGVRNLIENQLNGYLLNTNNENEYVKTMKSIQDNDYNKELIRAGLKTVKAYDRKNYIKAYIDFMSKLAAK